MNKIHLKQGEEFVFTEGSQLIIYSKSQATLRFSIKVGDEFFPESVEEVCGSSSIVRKFGGHRVDLNCRLCIPKLKSEIMKMDVSEGELIGYYAYE